MRNRRFLAFTGLLVLLAVGAWLLISLRSLLQEQPNKSLAISRLQSNSPAAGDDNLTIPVSPGPAVPSSIDLREDLPVPAEHRTKLDRWLSGEIDLGERDSILSSSESELLMANALELDASDEIQKIDAANLSANEQLAMSFDSIDITECCSSGANVPPDPDLAVGPHHVLAAVNVGFEIYDKSGNVLVPATTFAALWNGVSGCTSNLFDPNALYDEEADRYLLGIVGDGNFYCLAVSETADPTGIWSRYRFVTNVGGNIFDYPQAGVGRDAIYVGANMFDGTTGDFSEARVWAFDKWAMYANQPTNSRSHSVQRQQVNPPVEDTPQPANLHGFDQGTWPDDGPHYFLTETNFDGATYSVYSWDNPFLENDFRYEGAFNLNSATSLTAGHPITVSQLGGENIISNDWRLQDAEYRNGYLWTTDTISCNPGNGVVNCVRWAQVDPESTSVVQAGVIASDGLYRFFGDIGANHCNDMALGYSISGPQIYPGAGIASRHSSSTPGTVNSETLLKEGEIAYDAFDPSPFRWGDYTGMTNDPNGRDFWYIGQYSKDTQYPYGRWGTYVGCFTPVSCRPPLNSGESTNLTQTTAISTTNAAFLPIVSNYAPLPCGYTTD